MRLVIFHYHLLPGGVTQVITSSAIAALKYLPDIDGITLVSGKKDNTDNVIRNIKSKLDSTICEKSEINCVTLPELDYISDMKKFPDPESIKKTLVNHFGGDIWWVHNYHLGKNPFFTEALLQIAEEFSEQQIVLQVHDFPEASRYNNLEALHKYVSRPLYPVSPNIKYVTINSRDRNYLITAGIPSEMVFLLNNPVENLQKRETIENINDYTKIDKILSKSEPSYIKGAPLVVYPVRTIRRKNVLEAGLLAKCSRIPVNILPTLPGISKSEIGYSKIVDTCFRDKLIPGAAQAGIVLESEGITFPDIMKAGKIIISSSVQEGFGYLFINSLQWRKPLIARNLDIIKDFSDIFSSDFSYFYNEVNIPLSTTLRKQLIQEYDRKISGLEKFLDKNIISNLENQVKQIFKEDSIDFLYLSPVMQKQFLEKIKDKDLLEETRKMNTLLLKQME
ncbi:MAG: hypothetical protein KAQ93_09580, partial [Spirochaetales bacterium]|nr:hypothetical protein [Spirochaetales bacterium]